MPKRAASAAPAGVAPTRGDLGGDDTLTTVFSSSGTSTAAGFSRPGQPGAGDERFQFLRIALQDQQVALAQRPVTRRRVAAEAIAQVVARVTRSSANSCSAATVLPRIGLSGGRRASVV